MTKRPTQQDWNRMKAERAARNRSKAAEAIRKPRARAKGVRPKLLGGLFLLACLGVLVFQAAERFPEYLGPIVSAKSLRTVEGRVSHIRDGDTIEVNGVAIRFSSLDCAEMDTLEGQRAAARMRRLVSAATVTCHLNGRTSYDREIGSCRLSDGRDIAAIMMAEDLCRRFW